MNLQTGRLRGKNLFRATVRLILENIDWLKEKLSSDSDTEDSMTRIKNINRKKSMDKQVLTNEVLIIKFLQLLNEF